jgi:hypothetical protein
VHVGDEKCLQNFGWKTWREKPLERRWRRWGDNIKMGLTEIVFWGVDWVHVIQDRGLVTSFCEHGNGP